MSPPGVGKNLAGAVRFVCGFTACRIAFGLDLVCEIRRNKFLEAEKSSPNRFTQYRIGWMLLHGVGTERDEAAALPWLEKAAQGGNSFAKYQIGKLLLTGTDAVAKDTERALKLLTECAEYCHCRGEA